MISSKNNALPPLADTVITFSNCANFSNIIHIEDKPVKRIAEKIAKRVGNACEKKYEDIHDGKLSECLYQYMVATKYLRLDLHNTFTPCQNLGHIHCNQVWRGKDEHDV